MLEIHTQKRTKVHLPDYPYLQDVQNRILLADLTPLHYRVLEELIFSPLKVSIKQLARTLDMEEHQLFPILQRFAATRLLQIDQDAVVIDKERRKYFEFQIARFAEDFKPDMEFLQGLLRQVPIQVLPTWYSIPRTSNNIFESIVERYLQTPHTFQRYLSDLHFAHPQASALVRDLFASPELRLSTSDFIARYNLARETFEEIMITLEYHFVACVSYVREEDHWHEIITPFYEWRQYLLHLSATEPAPFRGAVTRTHKSDFAFVEDLSTLLRAAKKRPLVPDESPFSGPHLAHLLAKATLLKYGELKQGRLHITETGLDWLALDSDQQALTLYRHPYNQLLSHPNASEKQIREGEKAIKRILNRGWVDAEEFLRSALVPLSEDSTVQLKRNGKQWRYTLPHYTDAERTLLKSIAFEWLFECGIVAIGTHEGGHCLSLTPYGAYFFEA